MNEEKRLPFADAVRDHAALDLVLIPLGRGEGKTPSVRWQPFQKGQFQATREKLSKQNPAANVGLLCGKRNRITVLDGDSPNWRRWIELGGPTPLMVATPSGGLHLYYRHNGERPANLRDKMGLPADIKGEGSFVVIPPSYNFKSGLEYRVISGSLDMIRSGELPVMRDFLPKPEKVGRKDAPTAKAGERNDKLYRFGLDIAPYLDSFDELLSELIEVNKTFTPPETDFQKIYDTARSVWKYETSGQNNRGYNADGSRQYFSYPARLHEEAIARGFRNVGDMLLLWTWLRSKGRTEATNTKVVVTSIAPLLNMGPDKLKNALNNLIEMGVIVKLEKKHKRADLYKVLGAMELIRIPRKQDTI